MTKVPVIKFMFRSEWKVLADAIHLSPEFETKDFNSTNEILTYLSTSTVGMIVVSLRDKNDLIQLASLMKLLKKISANTFVKVMVVNFSGHKQFEKAVAKLGIMDLLEEKIQTKALRYKIDFMLKSINAQEKKNANAAMNSVKTLENSKNQEKKAIESVANIVEPLDCKDDIWLLKNEYDCKKVLTRWLVRLMGPSPYVASWVDSGTPGIWKFEFKSNSASFISGNGFWMFRGDQKPDFIWSENTWTFTGNAFDLFYKEGNDIYSRLKLHDKQLTVAKTSSHAKNKEKSILESFDKDLVFKKELQANGEKESFDKEQEAYKNLEGKGKTDTLNQGPLSGKDKTSHLNTDPMSLDLKPGDNVSGNDPLSQKANNTKNSSYWKGKNEYEKESDAELDAPVEQDVKSGAELSLEGKGKHEKYYKNHNEAEVFAAKDIGHSIKKDGVSDNLKGKIDPEKSTSAAGSIDLSGKGSTEQVTGHLTSPNARKEQALKEKNANELSGKTSTDKIQGHMSSLNNKEKHAEETEKNKQRNESSPGAKEKQRESIEENKNHKESKDKNGIEKPGFESGNQKEKAAVAKEQSNSIAKETAANGSKESSDDKQKKSSEAEAKPKSNNAELSDQLAALRAKKERIEKARAENGAVTSPESADDTFQEPKKDISSTNKQSARSHESGTDKISSFYSSKQKSQNDNANLKENSGKVLPFADKKKDVVAEGLDSKDLEDAIQTAKVTSYLIQDSVKIQGNLDDYFDETIIFNTNEGGIFPSKTIILNLNFNYMNKDTNLKLNGNVKQVESDDEGSQFITVEISKESARAFNSFMKIYDTRQKNIDVFFKAVKGE